MPELIVILVVALLVFGPAKLPELARSLGRGLNEFRRASTDIRQSLMETENETREAIKPPPPVPPKMAAEAPVASPAVEAPGVETPKVEAPSVEAAATEVAAAKSAESDDTNPKDG